MEFSNKFYFKSENGSFSLINGDTFKVLKKIEDKTFDIILQIHHISYPIMV